MKHWHLCNLKAQPDGHQQTARPRGALAHLPAPAQAASRSGQTGGRGKGSTSEGVRYTASFLTTSQACTALSQIHCHHQGAI